MLKFIVSVSYKEFKFEDSASAMTFATIAKASSVDDSIVNIEIIEEESEDV